MTSTQSLTTMTFRTCPKLRSISLPLMASGILGFSPASFAQYEATAYLPSGLVQTTTPEDVSYTYNAAEYGGESFAVVTFTASPIASVSSAITTFNPLGQVAKTATGTMTYRFEVEAQPFTHVPIDFSGLYSSSSSPASAGYGATTGFLIQTVNSSISTYSSFQSYLQGDCKAPICLQFTTFNDITYSSMQSDASHAEGSFKGTLDMLTGADGTVVGMVQLVAAASTNVFFVPASAAAFIDPHLEIDATFLAANPGATLTITPGVGNEIPAVPEPSTYALMLSGLAGLVVAARRRQPQR